MKNSQPLLRIGAFLAIVALSASCTTMSQSECSSSNWAEIGVSDGERGLRSTHYSKYQKACAEYGIPISSSAYIAGWETGIRRYCTGDNGFRVGNSGILYADSCPIALEHKFLSAFELGRDVHLFKMRVNYLSNRIAETKGKLESEDLNDSRRRSLSKKRDRLEQELSAANVNLVLVRVEALHQDFQPF